METIVIKDKYGDTIAVDNEIEGSVFLNCREGAIAGREARITHFELTAKQSKKLRKALKRAEREALYG